MAEPPKLVREKVKPETLRYKQLFVRLTPTNKEQLESTLEKFKVWTETGVGVRHGGHKEGAVGETAEHYHFILTLNSEITLDGFKRRLNALEYFSGKMLNVKPVSSETGAGSYLFHELIRPDTDDTADDSRPTDEQIRSAICFTHGKGAPDSITQYISAANEFAKTLTIKRSNKRKSNPIWKVIEHYKESGITTFTDYDLFRMYVGFIKSSGGNYPGKTRAIINIKTIKLHLLPDSYIGELFEEIKYDV